MKKHLADFFNQIFPGLCKAITCIACISVSTVNAVPSIPSASDKNSLSSDWMRYTDRHLGDQYKEVIKLLQQGKRKQAKLALGIQLARKPDPRGYEMAGIMFLEDGDNKLALASFDKAIKLNPNRISVHAKRGLTLLMLDRMEEGRDVLLQVLRSQPDNALALRYLGWFQDIYGHPESAINFYLKLLATDTYKNRELTPIHLELARLYNQLGQNKKAIAILSARNEPKPSTLLWALKQYSLFDSYIPLKQMNKAEAIIKQLNKSAFSDAPEVALRRATLAIANGKYEVAERVFQKLIDTNPAYLTPVSMKYAQLKIGQKKPEQAVKILNDALLVEKDLKQIKLLLKGLSSLLIDMKQVSDAKSILKNYINKYPDEPFIGYLLFDTQLVSGNQTAAMKTIRETLKRNPDFTDGWVAAGKLGRVLNKNRDSEKDFQKAVSLDPKYTDAWIELARLLFEEGREKEMESVLKLAISNNPHNSSLPFELASLYESQGRSDKANETYRLILQLFPDHIPSLNNLALNLARESGHDDEALKLASRAHELLPDEAVVMATYGWVTLLGGDVKKALPLVEKAAEIRKKDMGVQHYLAVAYMKSGKKKAAEKLIEKAEKLEGSTEEKQGLKTFLAQLRSGHKFSDEELRAISY